MNQQDLTVDDLFSDSGEFNEKKVVEALYPHITIQKSNNRICFKDSNLTADLRILAYILTKKLLKSKGNLESDLVTAKEINVNTGMKKGTIDPTFKLLKERGLLIGQGEYEIPSYKVSKVIDMLKSRR